MDAASTSDIASPALVTAGFAPRRCAPIPWDAVKKNRMNPMPAEDAQTCWGAKGRGLLFENAHMENAGED